MLPVAINMPGPATADKLPRNFLYKTRGHHVQHACLNLFCFLKARGVDRTQAEAITEDLGRDLRDKLDVKALLASDEIASKIFVTADCRFIFPPMAKENIIRESKLFIAKHPLLANWFGEQTTSDGPKMNCPSSLYTGVCTYQV